MAKQTISYQSLVEKLAERGASKAAASKAATAGSGAPGTPSVQVTEKDPDDKGNVAVPHDPQSNPQNAGVPGSASKTHTVQNTDNTPVLTPACQPKETIQEGAKAAKAVSAIQDFRKTLKKQAEAAAPAAPADAGKPVDEKKKEAPKAAAEGGAPPTAADKGDMKAQVKNTDKAAQGPKTDQVKGDKDEDETAAPAPREDAVGGVPAGAESGGTVVNTDKAAAENFVLDPAFHLKLASEILKTEDGRAYAEAVLEKSFGAEAAQDIIKAAAIMEQEAEAMAAYEQSGEAQAEEMWKQASESDKATITKLAKVHALAKSKLKTDWEKAAYDAGAGAAAGAMDAMPADDAAVNAAPAEAVAAEGAAPEGDITMEDILAVLQGLVESGQVQPEVAEQILQQLTGGGAEGGAPAEGGEGMPPIPAGGAGEEGAEEAAEPEVEEAAEKGAAVAASLIKIASAKK